MVLQFIILADCTILYVIYTFYKHILFLYFKQIYKNMKILPETFITLRIKRDFVLFKPQSDIFVQVLIVANLISFAMFIDIYFCFFTTF